MTGPKERNHPPVGTARDAADATPRSTAPPVRESAPAAYIDAISTIPEGQLTPKVRDAIQALLEEVRRLQRDLADNMARLAQLEKIADEDFLVPARNRRAFTRILAQALSYSARYGTPGSLLYFDINGMKRINDEFGHGAGDAALIQVARILSVNVRASDTVGRLGGDEFGVLLAQADEPTATEKGASLAAKIAKEGLEWCGHHIPLTVAYGVHTFRESDDLNVALDAADKEMYRRKPR